MLVSTLAEYDDQTDYRQDTQPEEVGQERSRSRAQEAPARARAPNDL